MKKAVKIIVNVLAWLVLIFALLITLVVFSSEKNNGVSNIFGFSPMTIESDSMSPTFKKGDMIVVKEVDDVKSLKEGDVITFWTKIDGKRAKNTHRIVKVVDEGGSVSFITRGDNNDRDDDLEVAAGDIIGKWTKARVPGFGKVMDFLRTKKGFFICIVIPMALFFLFELYKFIVTLIDVKKDKEPEIDEEEIKRRAIEEYLAEQKTKEGSGDGGSPAAEKLEEAKAEISEKAAETAAEISETAETVAEEIKTEAENAAETVAEAASDVENKVGDSD